MVPNLMIVRAAVFDKSWLKFVNPSIPEFLQQSNMYSFCQKTFHLKDFQITVHDIEAIGKLQYATFRNENGKCWNYLREARSNNFKYTFMNRMKASLDFKILSFNMNWKRE
jgi:hypothetical protein